MSFLVQARLGPQGMTMTLEVSGSQWPPGGTVGSGLAKWPCKGASAFQKGPSLHVACRLARLWIGGRGDSFRGLFK